MPSLLLQIPRVQQKLATQASRELSGQLNVPVKVGKVNIEWLNRLVLGDVSLEDRSGDLLFEADHVSAGFRLLPLLRGKWVFTTVRLFGFSLRLKKDAPGSELNLQFVIDAFSSRDSAQNRAIDLKIQSIQIRRGNIGYHIAGRADVRSKFDPEHIEINNLSGKITLKTLTRDSLNLLVGKLSFEEQSGFKLSKLSMSLTGNHDSLSVRNLDIRLPATSLHIPVAGIRLNKTDSLPPSPYQAPVELQIAPSQICLKDISAFVPAFKNFADKMEFSARLSGTVNDLSLDELSLKQNGVMQLHGHMNVKEITRPDETRLFGQISNLSLNAGRLAGIINSFQEQPMTLPEPLARLGDLNFSGEISGFTDHLVAYGKLQSDIGSLEMDLLAGRKKEEHIALYLKGQIASSELKINELFEEGNPFGIARFNIEMDVSRPEDGYFAGNIRARIHQLDYQACPYENILLAGNFRRHEFDGSIEIDDANGKLYAEGLFRRDGDRPAFDFSARVTGLRPDKLHLVHKYEEPELSLTVEANFTGDQVENFEGQIAVDHLSFLTRTDSFYLDSLRIRAHGNDSGRKLTVSSDLLNGEIAGAYSFSTMLTALFNTGRIYLPSLSLNERTCVSEPVFDLTMTLGNTASLSRAFRLPFTNLEQGQISGHYGHPDHTFRLDVLLPRFGIGKSIFESGSVAVDNAGGKIRMQARTTLLHKKGARYSVDIRSEAFDDLISTLFTVENDREKKMKIDLSASTRFIAEKKDNGKQALRTEITLDANRMIIGDSIWNLEPASLTIMDGNTTVDNFYISKGNQYLHINGTASARNPKETILLDLNDIELDHIFDVVNIPALQFGGRATGTVSLNNLYGTPVMNTELTVQNFSFNRVVQGRLNLFSEWDDEQQGILLLGTIYRDDKTWTDVNGYIYPAGAKAGLSLYFDARDLNLALLHPYVDAFTKTVEGRAFGNLHLFGTFSRLAFEGKVFVQDGRIGVDFLNTDYAFSDTLYLSPPAIEGRQIAIRDKNGNTGTVDFEIRHRHFKDFAFQVNTQMRNMLIYDMPEKINPQIYGTVYGSGNAQIKGNDQLVTIDANIQSNPKTAMGFNFVNGSTAEAYDFVVFREPPQDRIPHPARPAQTGTNGNAGGSELRVNCLVDVTQDAALEWVMDAVSGSKIKGNGNGDIRIQYGTGNALAMYGGYTILNGSYNFNLEQVIHKDFQIRGGSRIDFGGDPMDAGIDLSAGYFLTANIEDLDQSLLKETVRSSVPVNCLLKLNGRLQNPAISFDMEFPSSTDELARQVKSFIDTDDMMTRQIIYLLVLNKFYTPDYSRNDYRPNEFSAVASSALSSQLSGILNSLTDKVQIGTNIRSRQDGVTDTEVEMLLSSQLLDNRLLFNGNFGYKNNFIQPNAFIGEFDLEYKLTPVGGFRLKAYNHANDMYRYNNMKSLTRQGVGIMYHKDFTTLNEIFGTRKSKDK
jgi:hypothetical protein